MPQVKAIIFDSDGTLFNTFELIVSAYRYVAKTHSIKPPTIPEIQAQLGRSLPDIMRTFWPDRDVDELLRTNNDFFALNIVRAAGFDGLEELLKTLYIHNLKLAILTSGDGKNTTKLLQYHGFKHYFSSVVSHDRITCPKPDPEGLLLAAKECGASPSETIMVGDSVQDVLAGKNSVVRATIAVTHGYGLASDLQAVKADYIVDSLPAVERTILKLI